MIDLEIKQRIKTISAKRGFTLKLLAQKVGITEGGLFRMFEKDDYKTSTLKKMANVLDVPIAYFFSGNDDSKIKDFKDDINNLEIALQEKLMFSDRLLQVILLLINKEIELPAINMKELIKLQESISHGIHYFERNQLLMSQSTKYSYNIYKEGEALLDKLINRMA